MRKTLVLLVLLAMTGVSVHAQHSRTLGVYMDANSGTMASSTDTTLFSGTCVETGVTYTQGFENISWMKFHTRARVIVKNNPVAGADGEYAGSTGADNVIGVRARVGLQFAGAGVGAFLSMDTRGLLYQNLGYTFNFGNAGSLNLQQEMCLYVIPKNVSGTDDMGFLDALYVNLSYSVPVAQAWTFSTAVKLRWTDGAKNGAKSLGDSLGMRWENRITYAAAPKLSMYGQIRYQIDNLANSAAIAHDLKFNAGVSYSFDMSAL